LSAKRIETQAERVLLKPFLASVSTGSTRIEMKPSLEAPTPLHISPPETRRGAVSDVINLRKGITLLIRPICPEDAPLLDAFLSRLSPETIYFRFLSQRNEHISEEVIRLSSGDAQKQIVLVVTCDQGDSEEIIAVASCYINAQLSKIAEAAFMVENGYQGMGVGTLLIERLVACAYGQGIRIFQYFVHPGNVRMFRLLQHSGTVIKKKWDYGTCEVWARLEPKKEHKKWMAQGIHDDCEIASNHIFGN
jgi:acetate---CoA ligase (ADP-forming)